MSTVTLICLYRLDYYSVVIVAGVYLHTNEWTQLKPYVTFHDFILKVTMKETEHVSGFLAVRSTHVCLQLVPPWFA